MTHFILVTTPRSGSTWLGTLLDDHPDVSMFGEIFLPYDVPEKYKEIRKNDPEKFFRFRKNASKRRPKVTYAYLDYVFNQSEKSVGFKLMAAQLIKHPEIIFYCRNNDIRLIHLTRNTQDRVMSYAIAEQRKNFHNLSEPTEKIEKILLDKKLVRKLYSKQKILSKTLNLIIDNVSCPNISIDYDELLKNQAETLLKIQFFLDIAPHNPSSTIQKSSVVNYPELIENYDEVMKIFKQ